MRLWQFPEARQFLHLQGTTPPTVFSPDRRRLVTGGTNFECVLWELPEGRRIASLAGHKWQVWCVVFTPDSRRLVTTSTDATVRVWDARDGRPLALLDGHKEGVASAAVSPAGRTLATGGTDDTVKLWSLDTYQELLTLPDFGEDVGELLFSPDGNSLVVGPMIGNGGPRPGPSLARPAITGPALRPAGQGCIKLGLGNATGLGGGLSEASPRPVPGVAAGRNASWG